MEKFTNQLNMEKPNNNLSYLERTGLTWCKRHIKEKKIYLTQADKGGAILILDPSKVDTLIREELNDPAKYKTLKSDPCKDIDKKLKKWSNTWMHKNALTTAERTAITGYKGNFRAHHPAFKTQKPSPVPNFKLHSQTPTEIEQKIYPPMRFVSSSRYGPTFRMGKWLDNILTPISMTFCEDEYLKDSTHFLKNLDQHKDIFEKNLIFSLDVKAMYPSLRKDVVLNALHYALESDVTPTIDENRKNATIEGATLCIENAVLFYRDVWYISHVGIPTGGSESSSLANITLRYLLLLFKRTPAYIEMYANLIPMLNRFLDDIFGAWLGTVSEFNSFVDLLNDFMSGYGLVFDKRKTQIGTTVDFLDIKVDISSGSLFTDIYIKPTDSPNLLHRLSFAPNHLFKAIPYSQYRRASIISSTNELKESQYKRITTKLKNNGYSGKELAPSKFKALNVDRNDVLSRCTPNRTEKPPEQVTNISFVTTFNCHVNFYRTFFNESKEDLNALIGPHKIIMSTRKNPNLKDVLFSGKQFAGTQLRSSSSKPCSKTCLTCPILSLPSKVTLENNTYSIFQEGSCKSEDIIYLCICKLCNDFYIGQTITPLNIRMNGHRAHFRDGHPELSALSQHIAKDHAQMMHEHTNNYNIGILIKSNPLSLTRLEDRFIRDTLADSNHLNKYKPV